MTKKSSKQKPCVMHVAGPLLLIPDVQGVMDMQWVYALHCEVCHLPLDRTPALLGGSDAAA